MARKPPIYLIPHSGKPYTFDKIVDASHPNGVNITDELDILDYESCKRWCLYRCFCKAVDWDSNDNNCFFHANVDRSSLRQDAAANGVIHVFKGECSGFY